MKLYSVDLSPFAARVRMAIYAKGLDIEITAPPSTGLKSSEYLAINPMGKIPALETPDGLRLPESETIVEYLEDKFPTPSLRGDTPEATARIRLLSRVCEIYVSTPMQPLFQQMSASPRDEPVVEAALQKTGEGLAHLEGMLSDGPYAAGTKLTTADCWLGPVLWFLPLIGRAYGRDLLQDRPRIAGYVARLGEDATFQKVSAEMGRGLKAMQAARG